MATYKVVYVDSNRQGIDDWSEYQAIFEAVDAEFVPAACQTDDEVVEAAADADAILNTMYYMDADLIGHLDRARVIVRGGVGVDNLDVEACTRKGIIVCNVVDYGYNEVANHAFAMLLCLNRKLVALDRAARAGEGRPPAEVLAHTGRIAGETLGLCSLGNIAQAVARRAQGFDLDVIAFDPYVDEAVATRLGVELVGLDELMARSDYISVHTPLTEETRGMIGAEQLARCKPNCYLVITSRGGIVDEAALSNALAAGQLAGAGIDVWVHEPVRADDPLLAHPNVLASSHHAWWSDVSPGVLRRRTAEAAAEVLAGMRPRSVVNPEVLGAVGPLKPRDPAA
jgi:D-3-phosphoglycerate dehydrogenase